MIAHSDFDDIGMIDFVDTDSEVTKPVKQTAPQDIIKTAPKKNGSEHAITMPSRHLSVVDIDNFAEALVCQFMKIAPENGQKQDFNGYAHFGESFTQLRNYLQNRIHTMISVQELGDTASDETVEGIKVSRILLIACPDLSDLKEGAEGGMMVFTLDGERLYFKKPVIDISRTVARLYTHQHLRVLQSSSIMETFTRLYGT